MLRARCLVLLLALGGCHSMARIRMVQAVRTEGGTAALDVWLDVPGPLIEDPFTPLLFYPIDKISSLAVAFRAPFDPALDIQWGPLGALAGITLPYVTLIPGFYAPLPLPDIVLEREAFDQLLARVQQGDGVRAYLDLVRECSWRGGEARLHAVYVHDGAPAARAPPEGTGRP